MQRLIIILLTNAALERLVYLTYKFYWYTIVLLN